MAAYIAFAWFMVTTRAHENHDIFVLPLLVMATPRSRFMWAVFGLLTLTLLMNMALHDFGLEAFRASILPPQTWTRMQLANAGLNVLILVAWTVRVWTGGTSAPMPRPAPAAA
jgi:hypothetical protein